MKHPNPAAWVASNAADDAVRGAQIADKAAKKAVAAQQRTEELVPDPHKEMLQELALQEQSAFLHIGPRRNRWRDLAAFESEPDRSAATVLGRAGAACRD